MINQIKLKLDKTIASLPQIFQKSYPFKSFSPFLFSTITDYSLRKGKRLRPLLFILSYAAHANKRITPQLGILPQSIYTSAAGLELIHNFMLIHDDIIDHSNKRRWQSSLHVLFNQKIGKNQKNKFTGEDMGIIAGDVLFSIALDLFFSIKANPQSKETALHYLLRIAALTGCGQFEELLLTTQPFEKIALEDIHKIYDLKTAWYTFAAPLCLGAILAGASSQEVSVLEKYGRAIGQAFQIRDDIIGMFSNHNNSGKSCLTDLQESKRTILIFYAFQNADSKNRKTIKSIFAKNRVNQKDLKIIRKIIIDTGSLLQAEADILRLEKKAASILNRSCINLEFKALIQGL
ncbi:MAG: polyprenyl synthetase family protein [Candidatus Omnitrophica bacterium]|nr:polyprenyl synthetase family protein [Candidatus Omnitrophota bacterium]